MAWTSDPSGSAGQRRFEPVQAHRQPLDLRVFFEELARAKVTLTAVDDYLTATGRTLEDTSAMFRPTRNNRGGGALDKPLSPEAVGELLARVCKRAGVTKRITPHSLWHTSATVALDNGATVRKVSDFLGHPTLPVRRPRMTYANGLLTLRTVAILAWLERTTSAGDSVGQPCSASMRAKSHAQTIGAR